MNETHLSLLNMAEKARAASRILANANSDQKNAALAATARAIASRKAEILAANQKDILTAEQNYLEASKLDRLRLDETRLAAIIAGLNTIIALPDPVGQTRKHWTLPNGLDFTQIAIPIGVLAIIYESRPNVTIDAGALCLKSGNSVILRGGTDSFHSSHALHACFLQGLHESGLPESCVALVETTDRDAVGALLTGLEGNIDVVIPRGGKSLVARVQSDARIPVLSHLDGICHVYIDRDADIEKAVAITVNAKMRRVGVCGAAETLLIDRQIAAQALPRLAAALSAAGCLLKGDKEARKLVPTMLEATPSDWRMEYLDAILAVRVVGSIDEAIEHIAEFGSGHTETIVTENSQTAEKFLREVDSAIVMHNASTQFADGGEFGFGAEIGIATGRLHARGPVGLEGLTTYKYQLRGTGQTRP